MRKAIEKLEALLLEGHLQRGVPTAISENRTEQVVSELVELYQLAGK